MLPLLMLFPGLPIWLIGALLGARVHLTDHSMIMHKFSDWGVAEEYQFPVYIAALGLVGFAGWLFTMWRMETAVIYIIGLVGLAGYISGSIFGELVKQHCGLFLVAIVGTSGAYAGACAFINWKKSETLRRIHSQYMPEDHKLREYKFLTCFGFVFGLPVALVALFFGAQIHLSGKSPLYAAMLQHNIPDSYHTLILATIFGVPTLLAVLFWHLGKAKAGSVQEGLILRVAGGSVVAGYGIGALLGDMVKNHFAWMTVVYTVIAGLFLAKLLDAFLFPDW